MTEHDSAREAAGHLQQAAIEFIGAARAFLDVLEEAVREPGAVASAVTDTIGAVVRMSAAATRAGAENGDGVEHIPIR
jgi:hypothetical protein